ncbi:MAG: SDR family oxidoreductase [Planctomycetota bacterium]
MSKRHNVNHTFDENRNSGGGKYILLTGATGLVGRYLIKDLCLQDCRLAVIVRPGRKLSAEERVEVIQQHWEKQLGHALPRPVVFEGDVTEENLGLGQEESEWIRDHVDHIIHNAAVLRFTGADKRFDPWKTNCRGTQNVLDFSREHSIGKLSYVSTAYVSGIREEIVNEDDFDCGQKFRNDYERSKFEAERLVRAADWFDSVTIFRPAVIVGDSRTGYTSTYHGLFLYLRLLSSLIKRQIPNEDGVYETPISLPISGDEPRNLVPVDWVSAVISHIVCKPEAHGRTYHLTPDKGITPREIIHACYKYFNTDNGVTYAGSGSDRVADSEFARTFFEHARIYEAYESSDPEFNRSNVSEFAGHLPCPQIDEEMIVRFIEFGKADNWGKRRMRRPAVNLWFKTHLDQVAKGVSRLAGSYQTEDDSSLMIGLDIHGPGGGQWKVSADVDSYQVDRGLPFRSHGLLQMDNRQVERVVNSNCEPSESSEVAWASRLEQLFEVE